MNAASAADRLRLFSRQDRTSRRDAHAVGAGRQRAWRARARHRAFLGRGYNIESLAVSETSTSSICRVSPSLRGHAERCSADQVQLDRLVSVHRVTDLTTSRSATRATAGARAGADQGCRHRRQAHGGAAARGRLQGGGGRRPDRHFIFEMTGRPPRSSSSSPSCSRWVWSRSAAPASPRWGAGRRGCRTPPGAACPREVLPGACRSTPSSPRSRRDRTISCCSPPASISASFAPSRIFSASRPALPRCCFSVGLRARRLAQRLSGPSSRP